MITSLLIFFSLLCGAITQSMFSAFTFLGDAKPPILLGVMVYFALTKRLRPALIAAALAGLLHDSLTPGPLKVGVTSICFVAIAWVINESSDHLFGQKLGTQILVGVAGSVAMTVMIYVVLMLGGNFFMSFTGLLSKAWGTALLGTLAVPVVCRIIARLDRALGSAVEG